MDDDGAWDVDVVAVVVNEVEPGNNLPTASLQGVPTSGVAPLIVAFDAGASTDSDGAIVEYAWDWDGDGGYDTITDVPTISHTFADAGSPEVKLRVTDNDWARSTDTLVITVNVVGNDPPTASLTATPETGDLPLDVALDASGSTDSDGSIVNYEWDFDGDGVYDGFSETNLASFTYTTSNVFTAKVRVTDDAGAQDTDTVEITVNDAGAGQNESPTADLAVNPTLSLIHI